MLTFWGSLSEGKYSSLMDGCVVWPVERAKPLLVEQLEQQLGLEVFRRDLTLYQSSEKERWIEAFSKFLPPAEPLVEETLGAWIAYKCKIISKRELGDRLHAYPKLITVRGIYQFSPGDDYDLWNRIVGRNFLHELVDGLRVYYNYSRTAVDADGLYSVLLDLYYGTELVLNRSDIQILNVLSSDPLLSGRSLETKVRLAHGTVQDRLKQLRSRFDLKTTFQINYNKLGLERVVVYIPRSSFTIHSSYTLTSYLEWCGFLWSYNALALPVGSTLDNLITFLNRQVKQGLINSFYVYRNPTVEFFWNFSHYDIANHRWDLQWHTLAQQLRELKEYPASQSVITKDYDQYKSCIHLDDITYRIIWELALGFQPPLTSIAKKYKIPYARMRRLVTRLQKEGVIAPYMFMVRLGLQRQTLAVFAAETEFIKAFKGWCRQFPSSEFYHLEDPKTHAKGLLAPIGLPKDGIYQVAPMLDRANITDIVKFFIFEVQAGLGRVLPPLDTHDQMLYDSTKGEWLIGKPNAFQLISQRKK